MSLIVGLLWVGHAWAQTPPGDVPSTHKEEVAEAKALCVASFDAAQQHRLVGRVLAAREQLVLCAQQGCPAVVSTKCVTWLEEVRAVIPSVVVAVGDGVGNDIVNARLLIDGELVASRMAGAAIELEPGAHTFEVRHGKRHVTRKILLREGEQRRRIEILFKTHAPPPKPVAGPALLPLEPDDGFHMPELSWIGFGVGALGALLGGGTGVAAVVVGDDLEERCQQGICHPAEKNTLRVGTALAHFSTVSFVLAGLGGALGVMGLVIGENEAPTTTVAPSTALRLGFGRVSIEGTF